MKTTKKLKLDFNQQGTTPRIQAVQGDLYTRMVEIALFSSKAPWTIPEHTSVLIRYRKPDHTVGAYDTLPNGQLAYSLQGNTVTIAIVPDALMMPGNVSMIVSLVSGEQVLSVFEILLEVQPNHGVGDPSEGAGGCISGILPGPREAQEGQILAVEEVTPSGSVLQLKAIDLPYYNSVASIAEDAEASNTAETVYVVTMSDGAKHTFTVKNGSDGKDGVIGADGKSAYAYAKEAGYTGTEEEFAEKMADDAPPALYMTLLQGEGTQTSTENGVTFPVVADVTSTDIQNALLEGRSVFANSAFGILPFAGMDSSNSLATFRMVMYENGMIYFGTAFIGADGTGAAIINLLTIPDHLPNPNGMYIGSQYYDGTEVVSFTKTVNDMISSKIPSVPSTLPNPHKLVLTGAVYAEYDGTGAVTVEIPVNDDSETEMVLSDNLFNKAEATFGGVFYYSSSGLQLVESNYDCYAYVPLRGAGTYRTKINNGQHAATGGRIALVKEDNSWAQSITGTVTEHTNAHEYDLEFVVTQQMINNGAAKIAFDCYSEYVNDVMIVKDREYPEEYIPYGYIEVSTDKGKKLDNILCGKSAIFLGDSICAGTTVEGEYYNYGWAGLIGENNRMTWANYGMNGGTVTDLADVQAARWLSTQADTALVEHPAAHYVIFEGGCNDADMMGDSRLGTISTDYVTFDTTTFSGAFESLVRKLVTTFPTAKIGYIVPQKMYAVNDYSATGHTHRRFFDRAIEICRKWGIPYIDLWDGSPLNPQLPTASLFYTDGQHLTLAGYQRITPAIESWMRLL